MQAIRAIGSMCIVKTTPGHSSLGLLTVDGSREPPEKDRQAVRDHVDVRDRKQHGGSIVEKCVGDEEYGLQAMVEVSEGGTGFVWYVTTRKTVLSPDGRLVAHIFDPKDQRRIELSKHLLLPTVQKGFEACKRQTGRTAPYSRAGMH